MGMKLRGRLVLSDDEPTSSVHMHQQQGGPIMPYQQAVPMVPYNQAMQSQGFWPQRQPQHYQAGDERWVRTVSVSETSTNDSSLSLQKALNRQTDGNSTPLNLILGVGGAVLVLKVAAGVLSGLALLIAVIAGFFLGYSALRKGLLGNGNGKVGDRGQG
jgi:hypothetical protein